MAAEDSFPPDIVNIDNSDDEKEQTDVPSNPAPLASALANMPPIPLAHKWSVWFDKYTDGVHTEQEFEDHLIKVYDFASIQDFWSCFNNLPSITRMATKDSYHIMLEGVKPMWEDPANAEGGSIHFKVDPKVTEFAWQELVLSLIGGGLDAVVKEGDDINGLSVSLRYDSTLFTIWCRSKTTEDDVAEAVLVLRRIMPSVRIRQPYYKKHTVALTNAETPAPPRPNNRRRGRGRGGNNLLGGKKNNNSSGGRPNSTYF